jgi:NADH-quinone oxidoreductase subunit N
MLPLKKVSEFYVLIMSSLLGMFYMISSGHFIMLYIGLELATLPVAALASYDVFSRKSSESGIKLILSAALSSGMLLFGVSIMYAISGSLYFSGMAGNFAYSYLSILGLIMVFSGMAFKISLVPFHFWTADVYEGAPTPVTSFLSVISKGAAVFMLMILLFKVFADMIWVWTYLLYGISILTMFVGNFFALRQQNLQRFMAFSSVAQAGFIMMGLLSADQLAVSAVIYFIAIYVLSNIVIFGAIQMIGLASNKYNIDDYNGLYRTNPYISHALMIGLFSLAGIPPIAGFFGKFFLYTVAASQGYYWLIFIGVLNVTISLYYYLLIIRASFLRRSDNPIPHFKSDIFAKIGIAVASIILLGLGIYSPFYDYINSLSNIF